MIHTDKIQDANKKGLVAADWSKVVSDIVGGKAGGKGATSTGNGTNPAGVDEAIEAARKHMEKLGL